MADWLAGRLADWLAGWLACLAHFIDPWVCVEPVVIWLAELHKVSSTLCGKTFRSTNIILVDLEIFLFSWKQSFSARLQA